MLVFNTILCEVVELFFFLTNYFLRQLVMLHRVPKKQTGSLDGFWKIRDEEGYILNNDGQRSYCIHQWDRWYKDLRKFVDTKLF